MARPRPEDAEARDAEAELAEERELSDEPELRLRRESEAAVREQRGVRGLPQSASVSVL